MGQFASVIRVELSDELAACFDALHADLAALSGRPVDPPAVLVAGSVAASIACVAASRRLSRRSLLTGGLLSSLLLISAPAFAQTAPNRIDVVRQVSAADPARFACAHTGRPCEADWIKAVAAALHAIDPKFGLNGKRGNASDLSLDVVTYRLGPTDRHVEAFDICGACGGGSPSVVWNNITDYQTIGQPGTAVWVRPSAVGAPPPAPPPAPTPQPTPVPPAVDLAPILTELAAIRAELAVLRANHDGIAAVATEARDKAADAASEAKNAAERALNIANRQDRCVVGRVPRAFGGSSEVVFCPVTP